MIVDYLRRAWFAIKERVFLWRNANRHARFAAIYARNLWKNPESASGYGSTLDATRQARTGIEQLIGHFGITSILDVPCGDFNWMQALRFDGAYTGGDIVPDLIAANTARYGSDMRRFQVLDLVADTLPAADLVLCRECLNHLSLPEAAAAAANLGAAAGRLLVITHYPDHAENADQPASFRYRRLNLTLPPFNLRAPDRMIDESETEPGKVLAVWDVTTAPLRRS